jgi:hemoglobin
MYDGWNVYGSDLFHAIGGTPTCRKLSQAFYARVEKDPLLRPLFPGKTFKCAIEEFAAFLVQFLGGPGEDSQRRWWLSLRQSHRRFKIGPEHGDAWMRQMVKALEDAGIGEPAGSALRHFFERASAYIIDRELPGASTNQELTNQELARRWDSQRALDDAVAAVHNGDADRAVALAETCDRAVLPGLLALMIGAGNGALAAYVRERLTREPALVRRRYAGRTLLHAAAGAGNLAAVELLLGLGADPNAVDGGKHAPLYSVGNECMGAGCAEVVRLLVRTGARVNANEGAKRCTALHMAARRGNAAVARALLDCGAAFDARDRNGDTPLQRAINCRKTEVATLLQTYFCP